MAGKRARRQKQQRTCALQQVFRHLRRRLWKEEHMRRMHSTNRLIPPGSLKCRAVRALFQGWIHKFWWCGRIFTKRFAYELSASLRSSIGLEKVGRDHEEVGRLHLLLTCARKRLEHPCPQKMSSMDNVDTLLMLPEDSRLLFNSVLRIPGLLQDSQPVDAHSEDLLLGFSF